MRRSCGGEVFLIMNKKDLKFLLAPIGVAIGVSFFVSICVLITRKLGLSPFDQVITFIPKFAILIVGAIQIIVFLPLFISGIYFLGRRGAVGQSDTLITNGIYQYVRNPMYSGLSLTLFGAGLLLNQTGIVLAGLIWFTLAFFQCKREEKELLQRFGQAYIDYKNHTPLFIPNFELLINNIFNHKHIK